MRALITFLPIAAFSLSPAAAATPAARGAHPCFDVAIVATAPRYKWYPVDAGPDEIVVRSPVRITFDVEEVLAGDVPNGKVDVFTSLHSEFNSSIRHFLLFLRRDGSGRLSRVETSVQIVEDSNGDFVWPMAAPIDPSYWEEDRPLPADYEKLLKPIFYRPDEAWWLNPPRAKGEAVERVSASDYPWARLDHGWIVAPRGLRVRDLVRAVSARRCR